MDIKETRLTHSDFERWFDKPECYGLRSERFYDLVQNEKDFAKCFHLITQWMQAAFDAGRRPK